MDPLDSLVVVLLVGIHVVVGHQGNQAVDLQDILVVEPYLEDNLAKQDPHEEAFLEDNLEKQDLREEAFLEGIPAASLPSGTY